MKDEYKNAKILRECLNSEVKIIVEFEGKSLEIDDRFLDYILAKFLRKSRMTKKDLTEISNDKLLELKKIYHSIVITNCGQVYTMIENACEKTYGSYLTAFFKGLCGAVGLISIEAIDVPYTIKKKDDN